VTQSASPPPAEPFGKRVKRLREEQGILASHAAYLCGVTEGAIRQIESGQTKSASLHVGIRLAALLHVEPRYLAFGEGDGTEEESVKGKPGVISVPRSRIDVVETQMTQALGRLAAAERRLEKVEQRRR